MGKGAQGKKEKKAEKKGGDGSWPQVWTSRWRDYHMAVMTSPSHDRAEKIITLQ